MMEIKNLFSIFLKKEKIKDKYFLSLDIGTEAVKALIFQKISKGNIDKEFFSDKIIVLAYSVQYFEKYGIFESRDFERDVIKKAILKAVEEAKKNLFFSQAPKNIKNEVEKQKKWQVFLGISPDKFRGRIIWQVLFRENIKEKILLKEEKIICQQILRKAKKEAAKKIAKNFGILPVDIQWIFAKIIEMKIDGYIVPNLYGYEGKNLEFKILVTFLPKYYWENIKRILKDSGLEVLGMVHLSQTLPYLCKDEKENGIFIDVGGDVTQFFLVKNGNLQEIGEFNVGGKAFSQALSQNLRIDEESARILKERYSDRFLSIRTVQKIKEILSGEQKNWYLNFKNKIQQSTQKRFFLFNIYLFGGGSLVPEIKEILEEKILSHSEDLTDIELPEIKFIYLKNLKNIENLTASLRNPQCIPSLLICYYAQ